MIRKAIRRAGHLLSLSAIKGRMRHAKRHPFDKVYGVDTSNVISAKRIRSAHNLEVTSNVGYVGSQPSVIRRTLDIVPNLGGSVFIDIGCGKGRVCVVATEYAFSRIIGVEFGAALAAVAQRNAEVIRKRFPERTAIDIQVGDGTCFTPPDDNAPMVIFLYNPFGEMLIEALLKHLETIIRRQERKIFVAYYNPVHFAVFDRSPLFSRLAAERYDLTPEEQAAAIFGDGHESVILYQSVGAPMAPALASASRKAVVTIPDMGAVVEL